MSLLDKLWEVNWGFGKLLRFMFGGCAAIVMAYLFYPTWTKGILSDLGAIPSILVIAELGIIFYLIYHSTVGSLFIFWIAAIPSIIWLSKLEHNGKHIRWFVRRFTALKLIKRAPEYSDKCREVDLAHSELHMIYMTSLAVLVASFIAWLKCYNGNLSFFLICASVVIFLAAVIADIYQHTYEVYLLEGLNTEGKITELLERHGFFK